MLYNAFRFQFEKSGKKKLATGQEYGIILIIKGSARVNDTWLMGQDDILVCKPRQQLILEYSGGRPPLSLVFVRLSTELLQLYSTEQTDLSASFQVNPNPVAVLRGQNELLMLLKNLAFWLIKPPDLPERHAEDILQEGTLKLFISLVLRTCIQADLNRVNQTKSFALDNVFHFIHSHLTEDLSLERLEKEFYVSRHHLIRLFKQHTGQTVHQYIVKARLDRCRSLIEQGLSITAVAARGGFPSYNHFFRAFRQEYHMTPKEYYRSIHETPSDPS